MRPVILFFCFLRGHILLGLKGKINQDRREGEKLKEEKYISGDQNEMKGQENYIWGVENDIWGQENSISRQKDDLKTPEKEKFQVFVFLLKTEPAVWQKMDWDKVTTVCLVGWTDPYLTKFAHSKKSRVVFIAERFARDQLTNNTAHKVWVERQVKFALEHKLDGVNFDFEEELEKDSEETRGYTRLFKRAIASFHQEIPGSQVSIDVAWAPGGVDRRYYDYSALAKMADLVFIMSYDEQSQMWEKERCQARPNSPLIKTFTGVRQYLELGVSPSKLVLGVPWYGYRYPCQDIKRGICYIKEVPFRGCNCTDAAGREFAYHVVLEMLSKSPSGRQWDPASKTPWFDYKEGGETYQVWYDDPQSLRVKYEVARDMGLGGVGFWTGNFLDYDNQTMVNSMWTIIP